MTQRGRVKYLGALHDPSYGIDSEGMLFCTVQDVVAALSGWHRRGDGWREFDVLRPSGRTETFIPPVLTNEAVILLWELDYIDQTYAPLVAKNPIDAKGYMALSATRAVWIGARQAVRDGSVRRYELQRLERARQDVREAGSVVVTDA